LALPLGFSREEVDAMYDDIVSFAELEDFTAYDARMNEISLDDVDFESELQKLLDGGFGEAPEEK